MINADFYRQQLDYDDDDDICCLAVKFPQSPFVVIEEGVLLGNGS
jgi:hypothetical protein